MRVGRRLVAREIERAAVENEAVRAGAAMLTVPSHEHFQTPSPEQDPLSHRAVSSPGKGAALADALPISALGRPGRRQSSLIRRLPVAGHHER
jgi:hypothetical protein